MLIYKVLTAEQWRQLDESGRFGGAPIDLADGYIHFSDATQLRGTLDKHFAGQAALMLAAVDPAPLSAHIHWEPSRGGALFPHLYRRLDRRDVVWAEPLPLDPDGRHRLPARMDEADG